MTTPGTSAAGLLDAIGRLADVIERENAALGGRRTRGGPAAAGRETDSLPCLRGGGARAVRAAGADDAVARRGCGGRVERLGRVSAENRRRLAAAIAAHKRLLDAIAAAVRELTPTAGAYAAQRRARRSGVSLAPPAVSFDRTL